MSKTLNVIKDGKHGKIPIFALNLDIHSWNIYLEAVDLMITDTNVMLIILDTSNSLEFVELIIARGYLSPVLRTLYQLEIDEKISRDLKTEMFRAMSPIINVISTIFNDLKSPGLQKFRDDFMLAVTSSIEKHLPKLSKDWKWVAGVAEDCVDYLVRLPPESIPAEIIVILRSLRDTILSTSGLSNDDIPVMLGSIFFLRLICPMVSKPSDEINSDMMAKLVMVAKALQLISNQVDPEKDTQMFEIIDRLSWLHNSTSDFLIRVASMPMPTLSIDRSVIREAASLYAKLLVVSNTNKTEHLKDRLGQINENDLVNTTSLPMWETISESKRFIQSITK